MALFYTTEDLLHIPGADDIAVPQRSRLRRFSES